ncbi:MAG: hypothetical protein ACE5HA_05345 [Anaerolineae bacterium]
MASAGDVDDDGHPDVIAGAYATTSAPTGPTSTTAARP